MRSARTLAAVGLLLVLSARHCDAHIPSHANSTVPRHITLVGSRSAMPDAASAFTIVVRDLANNILQGVVVVVDFSGCTDLAMCSDQLDPVATVNCAAKTTSKISDATGSVTFTILGSSNGSGNATTLLNGVKIFGNSVLFGWPTASALDLDGAHGVGINDLSVWLSDYGAPGNPSFGRSDYDGDGAIDINDLSVWLTAYGAGGSVTGCAASCP